MFGNTVWTIITYVIPFSLFIPIVRNIIKDYAVTFSSVLLIALTFVIEFIFWRISVKIKKDEQRVDIENKNQDDEEEYKNLDYYFEEYHKHLTVYRNGNGIIINSFTIVVNNIDSITEFKRELDIHDAKKETEFPRLKIMKKTDLKDRFEKFGFWCQCLNNDKLILAVEEKYWTEQDENSDIVSKMDPKILKWILRMNPSSIELGKPYEIVYVMSIPGMFPIVDGYFNEESANIKGSNGIFSSQVQVKHKIKKFVYTISFENGTKLYLNPSGKIKGKTDKNLHFINDNNIIYYKYIFSVDSPEYLSTINIKWQFKSKQRGRRTNEQTYQNYKNGD